MNSCNFLISNFFQNLTFFIFIVKILFGKKLHKECESRLNIFKKILRIGVNEQQYTKYFI